MAKNSALKFNIGLLLQNNLKTQCIYSALQNLQTSLLIRTTNSGMNFTCEQCSLNFESEKNLQNHKIKFCINSKYGDADLLQKQFEKASKGRDISMFGKMSLAQKGNSYDFHTYSSKPNENIDEEYKDILEQISNKKDLKVKLDRQKHQAYQELEFLEKRENDLMIDTKQEDLNGIAERKRQLEQEEQQIQQEIIQFQAKQRSMESEIQKKDENDFVFQEGQRAGKLLKQREMLEEKQRQLEYDLKRKKKEKGELEFKLNESKLSDRSAPHDFYTKKLQKPERKVDTSLSQPSLKGPQDSLDSLSFQNSRFQHNNKSPYQSQLPGAHRQAPINQAASMVYPHQNIGVQHYSDPKQSLNYPKHPKYPTMSLAHSNHQHRAYDHKDPYNMPYQAESNPLGHSRKSNKTESGVDDSYPYLDPKVFSKNEKLLTDMLNRNGKSEEDLFIEQLNAQEYDSLNLLAKIPKSSELYNMKLNQYKELSKLRDEYKEKAHQKRIDKMKREFEFEKKVVEKELNNAKWVDENRKLMLAQQINVVSNQQRLHQYYDQQQLSRDRRLEETRVNEGPGSGNPNAPSPNDRVSMRPDHDPNSRIPSLERPAYQPYSMSSEKMPSVDHLYSQDRHPLSDPNSAPREVPPHGQPPLNHEPITNNHYANRNYIPEDSSLWGYKISVLSLKNYTRAKPLKVKVFVKEHDVARPELNSPQTLQRQFHTSYHYEKVDQYDPHNPNMNNKFDSHNVVQFKEDFLLEVNLQQLYDKSQNELYLFVFATEKDETKLTNEPSLYGWYCLKLTHFGQIKEGRLSFNFYGGDSSTFPMPADMNRKKNKLKEELTIELNQVVIEKAKPVPQKLTSQIDHKAPEIVEMNKTESNLPQSAGDLGSQGNQTLSSKLSSTLKQSSMNASSKSQISDMATPYFIPNDFETEFVQEETKKPKNLDISIGQLRTLPSYVGPVKIELTFIDKDNVEVIPREEVLAETSADLYNPLISHVHKIRKEKLLTPTTLLFIRILTVSSLEFDTYMLGFAVFYLFYNEDAQPCLSDSDKEVYISTGYYQIPIFWGACEPHYTSVDDILKKYPAIPCSSVLIGCNVNETKEALPIPKYHQKVYNTILFSVEEEDLRLFEEQSKRERLDAKQILNSYLKFKGINSKYTQEQTQKYLFKTMAFTPDNTEHRFPLEYMAEYNPFFGIKFSIDSISVRKSKTNYHYFMTVCQYPSGQFYTKKNTDELRVVYEINPEESTVFEYSFKNASWSFEPKYNLNSCLIVEFKRIKVADDFEIGDKIEDISFVIIPFFKELDTVRCANVMQEKINTYSGKFDPKDILAIQKGLPKCLDSLEAKAEASDIEFSFRLLNGFFPEQYPKTMVGNLTETKTKFLQWYQLKNRNYKDVEKSVKKHLEKHYSIKL